ncbi:MAG: alpha/beta fold hydrolase [Verrucomicrobiota bacterium]|jgi:pimeloyl-ACP methyl ester carboxylesterase
MQLFFKEYGQGRPLILLHGLFGSSDNWHAIARELAKRFHVYALDQRNHGHSPHSAEMSYSLMAEDAKEFLKAHRIEKASFIGHSLGGKTAMQFALQFPDKVEKLLIEDMAPRAYLQAHHDIFTALLGLDLANYKARQEIEDALALEIPSLVLRRFLLKNLGRNPDGTFFWKINLRGLSTNYPQLGEPVFSSLPFTKPVLFIRGGNSSYLNPEDEPLVRQLFPLAEIKTVAEAGHWVHGEKPEEFLALALAFL